MAGDNWMIYGAYGYTGRLLSALAVERGHRPVLGGRDAGRLRALATELDLPYQVVSVEDSAGLVAVLRDMDTLVNIAGPYVHTAVPVAEACIAARTNYVDLTGDLPVPPMLFSLDEYARDAGVVVLPSAGWEAVPTSCLTGLLHKELPDATSLELATAGQGKGLGKWSRGSVRTFLAAMGRHEPVLVRRNGELIEPTTPPETTVPFPIGDFEVSAIAWVDLHLAYRDTGIPDITFYRPKTRDETAVRRIARMPGGLAALQLLTRRWSGPQPTEREDTTLFIWGRVGNGRGDTVSHVVTTPNGYTFTADALVRIVDRLTAHTVPPGAHTPLSALGSEFMLECDGVRLD
jgi:saccharopine dehydrogenase (NAD+, L-lysine-forming)